MRRIILALALSVSWTAASAIEEVGQGYITPLATYIDPDGQLDGNDLESGFKGGQVAFGYGFAEHWSAELALGRIHLDSNSTDNNVDQDNYLFNVLNIYNRGGRFAPYLIGGVGYLDNQIKVGDSDSGFQLQGGVGLFTNLWKQRIALRTEVLYRWWDGANSNFGDTLVNVGLQFALGSKEEAPAPVVAAAPPPSPPPDPDSDRDGVVDRLDKCPGTPEGTRVDSNGCPRVIDSDGDGVADAADQCPDTPKGDRVGPFGCSCDVVRQVHFANNSAELTAEGKAELDELADTLTKLKFMAGTVVGHTDSTGSEAYNQKLSERRAQTVSDYLQDKGIASGRLEVSGAGESEPIADNATADGRAQNRRVVLKRTDCEAPR
jgi:OOP family OmpA-OmpF porin